MQRIYTLAFGTDGRDLTLPASEQIRGIQVDNPTGSWLRVSGVEDYVPPFTMGWSRVVDPSRLKIDVLFTDSPSGTPSQTTSVAGLVTVYVFDYPVPNSPGYGAGKGEYQTPEQANVQYRFDGFTLTETLASAAVTITPPIGFRLVLLRWKVGASLSSPYQNGIRGLAVVTMIDGVGAGLFPPIVLSPERPMSDMMTPTPRQLGVNGTVEIGGIMAEGAGASRFESYLEFLSVRG